MKRLSVTSPVPLWLPGLFAVLALVSLPAVLPRIDFDARDRQVELVTDLPSFLGQAEALGKPRAAVLKELAAAGATAVAIHPLSLADLIAEGLVTRLHTGPERREYRLEAAAAPYRVGDRLAAFGRVDVRGDRLTVRAAGNLIEELRVLLPRELAGEVRAAGLRTVYRLKNSGFRADYPRHLLELVVPDSLVIFDDKEALGYPSAMRPVAKLMKERNLSVGLVEFAGQRGVDSLARAGGLRMENVHSIPEDEMEKYPITRVLPRWVRAASERRVRVFYLRAFPPHNLPYVSGREGGEETGYAANLRYLRRIVEVLAGKGYRPGAPLDPNADLDRAPAWARGVACLGAGAALAWLLAFFRILPPTFLMALGLLLGMLAAFAGAARGFGLPANLLALAAACAAPAAGVLQVKEYASRKERGGLATLLGLPLLYLGCVCAGVLVFALLSDPGYLTRVHSFRGVKLVYLGPLALIGAYHLQRVDWHRRGVRAVDLGLLGLGALLGLVYLMRSGNFSPIPASGAEHRLRDRLEASLPYRPRTKEVAFGYPAMGFMTAAAARGDLFWAGWSSLGAAVAGVSATNSFCHLKTPFAASVGRGLVGLAFGLPIALLAGLLHLLLRRAPTRRWVVAGYAGFGNLGDDWITENLLAELGARAPEDVEITLLVPDPVEGRARFGVACVGRTDLLAVLGALRHAELFVTGPGGLVQDRTGWKSPVYYLGLHALARALGVARTAFLGEGFGPLASGPARAALRFYTASADLCVVRDRASLALAGAGAVLAPDASMWTEPPPPREGPPPEDGPVGLVLRDMPGGKNCFALPLARALAELVRDRELPALHLMPAFPDGDRELTELCRKTLSKEGLPIEVTPLGSPEGRELLGSLTALASMRLHGCYLAVEREVPLLALPYDPKVEHMLETTGYPHRAAPDGDPGEARGALEALLDANQEAVESLREGQRLLRLGREEVRRSLDELLGPTHEGEMPESLSEGPAEETPIRQLP